MPELILAEHGTFRRYKQEVRTEGVTPCEACREASRVHAREWRKKRGEGGSQRGLDNYSAETIAHGTRRGYNAHRRFGVTPCDACRQAKQEYERQMNRNRAEREKAQKRARNATMRVRKPGVVRQKFDQLTDIGYADKKKLNGGWAFNCPAPGCEFHSFTYDKRVTAETVEREHMARQHGGTPVPTPKKTRAAMPKLRLAGRTPATQITAA